MTKTGFENETVIKLINAITIIPLVVAGLYSLALFYEFIYPEKQQADNTNGNSNNIPSLKNIGIKVLATIIKALTKIGGVLGATWGVVSSYRGSMMAILGLYVILCYYLSKSIPGSPFLSDWSNYIYLTIGIVGVVFSLSILSTFINPDSAPNAAPIPENLTKRLAYTVKESIPLYKSALSIALVLGVVFLTFYIMRMYSFLRTSVSSFLQIAAVFGIIFFAFNLITSNAPLMAKIMNNKIFQLIYHTIFVVPCMVLYLTNYLSEELEDTPQAAWIILLVEVLLIGGYFGLPELKKMLFLNSVTKHDDLFMQQESEANDKSIIMNENKLWEIMNKASVDWDKIIAEGLYEKSKTVELKEYLKTRGYETGKKVVKKNLIQQLFDRDMSLESAITYVQINGPIIIDLRRKISMQLKESKNLSKKKDDSDNMFKTKILLGEPIYLNKEKSLGSYESIGSRVGAFNYNYAVSAWVFMHDQPPNMRASSNKFTTILDYANKPKIQFKPSENKLRITMGNSFDKETVVYETEDFLLQRWNNIVVNYSGGTLDIFINGKLKSTHENVVPIMTYDGISVGEDEGLSGGVCNVVYYPEPLTLNKITTDYKNLRYKNPPVV